MKTFIKAASEAETNILNSEISDKQIEINSSKKDISNSCPSLLEKVNDREVQNLQKALDKKFNWLLGQDLTRWKDWPVKIGDQKKDTTSPPPSSQPLTSYKKLRNAAAKLRRAGNRIKKLSQIALDSGAIVNLSSLEVPPEAIVILSKRLGFVPTSSYNKLESRIDANAALSKLTTCTVRKLKENSEANSVTQDSVDSEECSDDADELPDFLQLRKQHLTPSNSGDAIVDGVKDNLLAFVDTLQPRSLKSNLNSREKIGLNWVLKEIGKGQIQFVKADKGGALCIIDREAMRNLEAEKLENCELFDCLGDKDPTQDMTSKLLELWREGETQDFVSRNICYSTVGICDSGRPSTLSLFKPGTPYYYGLLKIHKCKKDNLIPGAKIPIRLVNDLSQSPTSRSDKYINWKYLKPLQNEFCTDLIQDSAEALKWLDSVTDKSGNISSFAWDFSALYDNLSIELVLEALLVAITECRPDWSPEFIKWICDLVVLNLNSSVGKFGNYWYRSKVGIVTGGSLSVSLANIAVFYALRCALSDSDNGVFSPSLLGYKRFLDDVAGLWTGSNEEFVIWADSINSKLNDMGLSIKDDDNASWDFHKAGSLCTFLDIQFAYKDDEGLFTDINIKPTDARVYLHYSSFHPRQTFKSIVYSQGLRYRLQKVNK